MSNETPTPIPEDFKIKVKEYVKSLKSDCGMYDAGVMVGAEFAFRLLASQQTMRWVKASEMLPPEDKLVFCRTTRGRKIVTSAAKGEWDNYWLNEDEESVLEWLLDESPAPTT